MSDKKWAGMEPRPYNKIFDTILFRIILIIYVLIFLYTFYILIKIYPPYPLFTEGAGKISAVKSLTAPWIVLSLCVVLININVKKLKMLTVVFISSNAVMAIVSRILIESLDLIVASYLIPSVWLYFLMLSAVFLINVKRFKPLLIVAAIIQIILYLIVFVSAILKSYLFVFVLLMLSLPIIIFANIILLYKPAMIPLYFLSIICNSYNFFWKIMPDNGVNILANIIITAMIAVIIYFIVKKIRKWYCNFRKDVV